MGVAQSLAFAARIKGEVAKVVGAFLFQFNYVQGKKMRDNLLRCYSGFMSLSLNGICCRILNFLRDVMWMKV